MKLDWSLTGAIVFGVVFVTLVRTGCGSPAGPRCENRGGVPAA
jgi:hypothetical protein